MIALSAGHPQLAARLSESLADLFVEHAAREVGRWLGIKGDTVSARGRSVASWPLPDLLILAKHFPPIGRALTAYVCGADIPRGDATAAVGELLREVSSSGTLIAHATVALADGRVSEDEAAGLLDELTKRREHEDLILIPALNACAKGG